MAKTTDSRQYSIRRFTPSGAFLMKLDYRNLEETKGIVTIVWGVVPDTLETGGDMGEEWKLHMGEGHWVVVERTR